MLVFAGTGFWCCVRIVRIVRIIRIVPILFVLCLHVSTCVCICSHCPHCFYMCSHCPHCPLPALFACVVVFVRCELIALWTVVFIFVIVVIVVYMLFLGVLCCEN